MIKGSNFSDGTKRMVGVVRKECLDKPGPCFCPFLQPSGNLMIPAKLVYTYFRGKMLYLEASE